MRFRSCPPFSAEGDVQVRVAVHPGEVGWTTVVASSCSTIAGPAISTPGRSRVRSTRPWAQTMPGTTGTRTARIPRAAATSRAWSGPAPPKATRVKSRGVVATLDRDGADRAHHVGDHHPDHPVRGPLQRIGETTGRFALLGEYWCGRCQVRCRRKRGQSAVDLMRLGALAIGFPPGHP